MKPILFFALFLIIRGVFAQETQPAPSLALDRLNKYSSEGVVRIDSVDRVTLLEGAYKWLSGVKYVNTLASKGIVLDEVFLYKIVVNQYFIPSKQINGSKVRFVLTLEFRDSRYKFHYTDFTYYAGSVRTDFEKIVNLQLPEQKILLQKLLLEASDYVRNSVAELTEYLKNYSPDASW